MHQILPNAFALGLTCLLGSSAIPTLAFAQPTINVTSEIEQEKGRSSRRIAGIAADTLDIFRVSATEAAASGLVELGLEYVSQRINSASRAPSSSYSYIGSYYVEPNRGIHILGTSSGQWYAFNYNTRRWDNVNPPNFNAYRMADFYRNSSGQVSRVTFF